MASSVLSNGVPPLVVPPATGALHHLIPPQRAVALPQPPAFWPAANGLGAWGGSDPSDPFVVGSAFGAVAAAAGTPTHSAAAQTLLQQLRAAGALREPIPQLHPLNAVTGEVWRGPDLSRRLVWTPWEVPVTLFERGVAPAPAPPHCRSCHQ